MKRLVLRSLVKNAKGAHPIDRRWREIYAYVDLLHRRSHLAFLNSLLERYENADGVDVDVEFDFFGAVAVTGAAGHHAHARSEPDTFAWAGPGPCARSCASSCTRTCTCTGAVSGAEWTRHGLRRHTSQCVLFT